jgi:folate-binding protein YgfZ
MTGPFYARVDRDLVVVHGPDATSFLQNLLSQDLDAISLGAAAPTLLLQPQGKLLVAFTIRHSALDEWWCVCEGGFGEVLAAGLRRFKIRVKVEIEGRSVAALALRGVGDVAGPPTAVYVEWDGAPAADVIGTPEEIDALTSALTLPLASADEYERARIEAGVPKMGVDIDERTIPQEAGLEVEAVSFTKGCFVGQELVCRIDTRGHVNRMLRRLRARAGDSITVGADVEAGGKVVGTVTSAAGDVGLALLRREVEPAAVVRAGVTDVTVEVARSGFDRS